MMAFKWETKDIVCGHVYHISFPYCPWCYELEDVTCACCGHKKQRAVLTKEGKRVRAAQESAQPQEGAQPSDNYFETNEPRDNERWKDPEY